MRHYTQKLLGMALVLSIVAGCSDTNEPLPTPTMSVHVASTTLSVQRGQAKEFPVTVTRGGGFTGSVLVSVTGLPADLSVGCSPASVLGNSATLNVAAGASQALGSFTATMKATGSGVASQTILLTINVIP